jgi:hypothetical protein
MFVLEERVQWISAVSVVGFGSSDHRHTQLVATTQRPYDPTPRRHHHGSDNITSGKDEPHCHGAQSSVFVQQRPTDTSSGWISEMESLGPDGGGRGPDKRA